MAPARWALTRMAGEPGSDAAAENRTPSAAVASEQATSGILQLDGVSKSFGGLQAVADVTLTFREGEVTAVIGPNGAGKTTLFNIIAGYLPPTSGTVRLRGRDVTGYSPGRLCRLGIARTFQTPRLFPHLTIRENVLAGRFVRSHATLLESVLGLPRSRREVADSSKVANELLNSVGLWSQCDNFPDSLPYGDRRRLEIARALATRPSLLLMDEPAAGIMAGEALKIMDLARGLVSDGITVVLIEHNMQAVMSAADHVVVLNFGRVIAQGPPAVVQRNPDVVAAYLGVD
jgi:branched-chain amino acid transport system ATP-binding protein